MFVSTFEDDKSNLPLSDKDLTYHQIKDIIKIP